MNLEHELAQHNSSTLRAIEAGRIELAERRLKAYLSFAQAFLDATAKRGLTFSLEASRSVSSMDWRTPHQIINYTWDGILASIKSGNSDLMLAATYLPIQFMEMSVEKGDFLFYRRMSQIYPAILATSYVANLGESRGLLIDRSWRYPLEFADYFLPKLTATHDQNTRQQFVSELVWRFGDLMKVAMDHSDTNTFAIIGSSMDSLFHNLEIHGLTPDAASSLEEFSAQEKAAVWFGFGAWILRSFVLSGTLREPGAPDLHLIEPGKITEFIGLVANQFLNIKQLAATYQDTLTREHRASTWEGWLMDTLPERQAHTIDFRRWVTSFYIVMGLRLSKSGSPVAGDIPAPFRDLQFQMKDIKEDVARIRTDQQRWASLIPQLAVKPVEDQAGSTFWDYFISANDTAVKEWERQRENEIIASPVSPRLVNTFLEQSVEGWNQSAWLVKVFSQLGRMTNQQAESGATYRAIDVLVPKEAFIESNDTHYVGLGRDQAATVGRDTATQLLSLIDSAAQDAGETTVDRLVEKLSDVVSSMPVEGSSLIALLSGHFDLERKLLAYSSFTPRWTQPSTRFSFSEYLGDMNNLPVFFIHNKQSSSATVVDLSRVGELIWYLPSENNVDGLLVRITEINEGEARRVIDKQPKFLEGSDGAILTHDAAIRNLLLKIRMFIGVKIELKITSPDSIRKISVTYTGT